MKLWRFLLIAALVVCPAAAMGQAANPNPAPGSVWTYLGATYGAAWMPLSPVTLPAELADARNTGLPGKQYSFAVKSQTSSDADAYYIWSCSIGLCNSGAAGNFDVARIIAISPVGQLADLANGLGVYYIQKTGRTGPNYPPFPTMVGVNVTGICDADGAGCWAGNSIITDNRGQGTATPKPLRVLVGWEADFHANSVNSWALGFLTGGTSTVQPASAVGYSCVWLDGNAAQGTIAKWQTCFSSQHGSATVFATVGTRDATGANTPSQIINMYFRDAANALQNLSVAAGPGGLAFATTGVPLSASLSIPAGAVFAAGDGGGTRINNRVATQGTGTVLSFGSDAGWTQVRLGNTTGLTQVFGSMSFLNIATSGTAAGSLCLDAANVVFKKTTAGPCL